MRFQVFLLCIVLVALTGCGANDTDNANNSNPTPGSTPNTSDKRTIGISVQTLGNPFFKLIAETVESEAAKHGWETLKRDAEEDIEIQKNQVNDFIVKKVDAIVLCPRDSMAIGESVKKANEAGIPVFTVDTVCDAPDTKIAFHVGTDNYQGGKVAGQAMVDALGDGGGKVAVLDFKDVDSCIDRVRGFKEVVEAHNKDAANPIEIVGEYPCKGEDELGKSAAADALSKTPDLKGIFAINDPSALGAYKALEAEGKTDQVVVVGFDGQPIGKEGVLEGKLFDTPTQFPDKMSVMVVEAIVKYFDGEKIDPASVLIETESYRKANAEKELGNSSKLTDG